MGAWKLGGLSLACPSFITADTAGVVPTSYRDPSMERFMRWQQVRHMIPFYWFLEPQVSIFCLKFWRQHTLTDSPGMSDKPK